jgi:hypothetical protein
MKPILALLLAPLLAACSVLGMRSTEEPAFTVMAHQGEAEIRRYAPRLVAEVLVEGDEATARNRGFRPLAAYIFGENQAAERIGMTAPVAQGRAGEGAQGRAGEGAQAAGERIGMTAPVAQAAEGGAWRIGFYMPARYTRASLPAPRDPGITIREVPEALVAVRRFSGLPTEAAVAGAWFYDPPWTVPGLRRSEVWLPVAPGP